MEWYWRTKSFQYQNFFGACHSVVVGEKSIENRPGNQSKYIQISYSQQFFLPKKINDETNIQLTNRFIRLKTIQAAQNLKKRGYEKGDVFTVIAKNSHYLAPIVFASVCLGCPINCLDVSFAAAEMVHMMSITQPSAVFCDADVYELVKNCLGELENGAKVYTFSGQTGDSIAVEELFVDTGNEENFK